MEEKPFYKKTKFLIVVIGLLAVLAIVLGGAALGISDDERNGALDAIKWLIGLWLGGHAATDIAKRREE